MEKIQTTDQEVMDTLRAVVAEQPDHVYENPMPRDEGDNSCLYVHGDEPGCLIGHVLSRLGVPLGALSEQEGNSAWEVSRQLLAGISGSVERALATAQDAQDSGDTWAEALKAAGQA